MDIYSVIKQLNNMKITTAILPKEDGFRISMYDEETTKTTRRDIKYSEIEKLSAKEDIPENTIFMLLLTKMKQTIINDRPNRLKKDGDDNET